MGTVQENRLPLLFSDGKHCVAASTSEPNLTSRWTFLETVKHSQAYWTLKVLIGTAAAMRLLDVTSNGSRIEPAYPE